MILHSDTAGLRGYPGLGATAASLGRKANNNYTITGQIVKTGAYGDLRDKAAAHAERPFGRGAGPDWL